jgi:hypothetical protein
MPKRWNFSHFHGLKRKFYGMSKWHPNTVAQGMVLRGVSSVPCRRWSELPKNTAVCKTRAANAGNWDVITALFRAKFGFLGAEVTYVFSCLLKMKAAEIHRAMYHRSQLPAIKVNGRT